MALAMLWLTNGKFRKVEPETAVRYWNILHGREEPTEEEGDKLQYVKNIFIPPSYRPADYHEHHQYAKLPGLPPTKRAKTDALHPDPAQAAIDNGTDWQNN